MSFHDLTLIVLMGLQSLFALTLTRLLSLPAESQLQLADEKGGMIILKVIVEGEHDELNYC
jgi:hypothetical protein